MSATLMPTVAMIGGGQLARMTHQAAIALGQSLRVLAGSADDPAAQVAADVVLGSHEKLDDLRAAARGAHAVTFDHEHVPLAHLRVLEAEGVAVHPPSAALEFAQNKLAMRRRMTEIGAPNPDFAEVTDVADVAAFAADHPAGVVLKTVRGGYDGRGVWVFDGSETGQTLEIAAEQLAAGTELMVEERVELRRELAVLLARSPFGQGAAWPVVETVQRGGQCAVVFAPAPNLAPEVAAEATEFALRVAAELGVVGVLAVELFEATDGRVLVNELAMRPHNSGHWTMDGSCTSQFEQHLRAVLDYPLGATVLRAPVVVMANVLGAATAPTMSMDERVHHLMARMPDAKVHLYGKAERPDRKIGHINLLGEDHEAVRTRAELAATWLSTAVWTDGWDPHA